MRVELGPRTEDPFGRLLYYLYLYTDGGDSIDETLVAEGLAVAWTRDGQHRDYLVSVEQEARRDGVGCLWWWSEWCRRPQVGVEGCRKS